MTYFETLRWTIKIFLIGEKMPTNKIFIWVVSMAIQKYSKVNDIDIIVSTVAFKTSRVPIGFMIRDMNSYYWMGMYTCIVSKKFTC